MEIDAKEICQALAKQYFKRQLLEETDQESRQISKLKTVSSLCWRLPDRAQSFVFLFTNCD